MEENKRKNPENAVEESDALKNVNYPNDAEAEGEKSPLAKGKTNSSESPNQDSIGEVGRPGEHGNLDFGEKEIPAQDIKDDEAA